MVWQKRSPLLGPGFKGRFDDKGVASRHLLMLGDRDGVGQIDTGSAKPQRSLAGVADYSTSPGANP
ncbi:MAG: hypothetical protein KDI32_02480 [Pseudomonadales bacterium]|nr:hypothetical protein [Pseudomonadales bacterium]